MKAALDLLKSPTYKRVLGEIGRLKQFRATHSMHPVLGVRQHHKPRPTDDVVQDQNIPDKLDMPLSLSSSGMQPQITQASRHWRTSRPTCEFGCPQLRYWLSRVSARRHKCDLRVTFEFRAGLQNLFQARFFECQLSI